MIIARAPLRISLAGGGTDLPWYAAEHGARLLTMTIDRYVTVMLKHREWDKKIRVAYRKDELVDDASLTFPAGDSQALAQSMQKVLQDPSIIESLGQKARERALRYFRRERMIEDHVRLYRQALEGGDQ